MLAERIPVVSNDMFHEVGARMAGNRRIATARRDVQGEEQPCGATEVHDVGDNGDINNANEPLAHAAVVVQYVNRLCTDRAGR